MKIGSKNDEFDKKYANFAKIHEKIEKFLTRFCKISGFEAVQRNANLVDLEKC